LQAAPGALVPNPGKRTLRSAVIKERAGHQIEIYRLIANLKVAVPTAASSPDYSIITSHNRRPTSE
jgi:hypothetical protein